MRVLCTAFKGANNSSYQFAMNMPYDKLFLTNSMQGVARDIELIELKYDYIFMFGLDKTLQEQIRIELTAQKDDEIISTKADVSGLCEALNHIGIEYNCSSQPTHYLCNEAYFQMMKRVSCPVLFIHIPSQKHMSGLFFDQLADCIMQRLASF